MKRLLLTLTLTLAAAFAFSATPAHATQQAWTTFKGCEFANDQISWAVTNQTFLLGVSVKSCAGTVTQVKMTPCWQHYHFNGFSYNWVGPMCAGQDVIPNANLPRGTDPPHYFPDTSPCGNTGNPGLEMFYGETAEVGMYTYIEVTKGGSVFNTVLPYNVAGQYATCAL